MIAIVDYGVGNIFSLVSSFRKIGEDCIVTSEAGAIAAADGIVLPGVGAFGDAAAKLRAGGLDKCVKRAAENGKPLLGICLGMQLLFDVSYEYGRHEGLGLIRGEVRPLAERSVGLKIPHMGWNSLDIAKRSPVLADVKSGEYVYFVHSYCAECANRGDLAATARYGTDVTAVVSRGNIHGTQFHPEKSGETGLRILKAFVKSTEVRA